MIEWEVVVVMILGILGLALLAVTLNGTSYETGSLYKVDHYYIEAEGQTYKVIVDRSGGHHVVP